MKFKMLLAATFIFSYTAMCQPYHSNRYDHNRRDQRYAQRLPAAVIIPYRNYNYHYANGYFYRPFGAFLRVVIPPVGIYINILPRGYQTIYYPGGYCYYCNGIYYRQNNHRYEVIDAPAGAIVPGLLAGAKTVIINNEKLYELNGIYYKEEVSNNGDINYKVVGKKGEATTEDSAAEVQQGETIEQLPEGSKAIVINGKKLYVSPSNDYFEEITEGNNPVYKKVGTEVK